MIYHGMLTIDKYELENININIHRLIDKLICGFFFFKEIL